MLHLRGELETLRFIPVHPCLKKFFDDSILCLNPDENSMEYRKQTQDPPEQAKKSLCTGGSLLSSKLQSVIPVLPANVLWRLSSCRLHLRGQPKEPTRQRSGTASRSWTLLRAKWTSWERPLKWKHLTSTLEFTWIARLADYINTMLHVTARANVPADLLRSLDWHYNTFHLCMYFTITSRLYANDNANTH